MSSAYTISYITTLPYPGTYSKNRKDRKFATLVQNCLQEKFWLIFEKENVTCVWNWKQTEWGEIFCEGTSLKFIYYTSEKASKIGKKSPNLFAII